MCSDEADVFLENRSDMDPNRNALVSGNTSTSLLLFLISTESV